MWLMKTLLTSRCINQRGAGQKLYVNCEDKDYNAYWFSFDETGNLYEISLILDE